MPDSPDQAPPLLDRLQVVADQLTESQLPSGDLRRTVGAIIAVQEGGDPVFAAAEQHAAEQASAPPAAPVVTPAHVPEGQQTPEQRQAMIDQGLAVEPGPGETTPTPTAPVAPVSESDATLAEENARLRAQLAQVETDAAPQTPPASPDPAVPLPPPDQPSPGDTGQVPKPGPGGEQPPPPPSEPPST